MKILFITASRIGDAVLSTGLLHYMAQKYPSAKVTIVCGPLCASLFEGYPLRERIIPLRKKSHNRHWLGLWAEVVGTRWDLVVDLRNSAVSRLIAAQQRYIFGGYIPQYMHKVEQNAAVMRLDEAPSPHLWFTPAQEEAARALIPDGGPVLGVGPTANWRAKTWPAERFIEVINRMIAADGVMPGARVAVFAAQGEEEGAYQVLNAVPEHLRLDVIARTDPGTAAAALARCGFYIGNDSGLMHCAAASGVPTLGLFGPSYPQVYGPWGSRAAYVSTPESFDELTSYQGYDPKTAPCLMRNLSVESVMSAVNQSFRLPKSS